MEPNKIKTDGVKTDWINKAYPWVSLLGLWLMAIAPEIDSHILGNIVALSGLWGCGLLVMAKTARKDYVLQPFPWLMCKIGMVLVIIIAIAIRTASSLEGCEAIFFITYLIGIGSIGILIVDD